MKIDEEEGNKIGRSGVRIRDLEFLQIKKQKWRSTE